MKRSRNPLKMALEHPTGYRLAMRQAALAETTERWLRRISRGRIGIMDLVGLPSARLTVAGRKTGTPRTVTVQCVPDGDRYLVVGSNWARPTNPVWSENLSATQEVLVQREGETFRASVRRLEGHERERAWNQIIAAWPNYQIAQGLAGEREFPVFQLAHKADQSPPS